MELTPFPPPTTAPCEGLFVPSTHISCQTQPRLVPACRGMRAAGVGRVMDCRGCTGGTEPRQHSGTEPHHLEPAPAHPQQGWDTHHPHLGEVHQPVLSVIRGTLLDERQVSQVHSQVGDAWRVTTLGANQKQIRKKTALLSGFGAWRRVGLHSDAPARGDAPAPGQLSASLPAPTSCCTHSTCSPAPTRPCSPAPKRLRSLHPQHQCCHKGPAGWSDTHWLAGNPS